MWRIEQQCRELRQLFDSASLRNQAEAIWAEAYEEARQQAAEETEMELATFPVECIRELDSLIDDTRL